MTDAAESRCIVAAVRPNLTARRATQVGPGDGHAGAAPAGPAVGLIEFTVGAGT